jgi:uracil-DNA glycosylase family 4
MAERRVAAARRGEPFNPNCTRCPRLARALAEVRREHADYYSRPVPPFGELKSIRPRLLVVGLAPGLHGANRTGRPFTGDGAGGPLYRTLHATGFATRPESVSADDGLRLVDCGITNAVRCWPPANKPQPDEIRRCNTYLLHDLERLPPGSVILALGAIAHRAVLMAFTARQAEFEFRHGAEHHLASGHWLLDSYHCSRYNTNTGRLTEAQLQAVFRRARELLKVPRDR